MKRTLALMVGLLMVTGFAAASSHSGLMTADHPLYGAKMAGEEGVEGLAPNETEEVEAKVNHAGKRANESEQLAEENKTELANETASAYAKEMKEVNDLGSTISDLAQKQKIDELVAKATQHHAAVLSKVYERVPEQAKAGIQKALDQSVKGHDMAVEAMKQRGEPTERFNMSEHIPSDVRERMGVDPASLEAAQNMTVDGAPDDGDQQNDSGNDSGNGAGNAPAAGGE